MLYQAVTGSLPFRGTSAFEITSAILRDSAPPLSAHVPPGLAAVILRVLAKPPGERYQRAGEVRAALNAIQPSVPVSGPVPTVRVSRRRWLWAAAVFPVAAILAWLALRPGTPATGPRLSDGARSSTNAEANEYYERGLLFSGSGPRHDLAQWRRMLERALEIDPKFAAARGQYAFTSMLLAWGAAGASDPSLPYKAEEEARQALRDDPDCAVAHSALAGIYLNLGRKELVLREVDQALRANPHDPAIHLWHPLYYHVNGDYEQALQQYQQIVARWALFWPARHNFSLALREQGDAPGAIRELERILEQDPTHVAALWDLARVHMDLGDLHRARQFVERVDVALRQHHRVRLTWALLLALEGKRTDALREMDEPTLSLVGTCYLGPLLPAEVYAVLGDTAKALEWVDRAVRSGDEREDWFRRDPHLASIRNHPRFQQVLDSVAYRRRQRAR
jgi:Tfp pilus assembly protein PilF